MLYILQVFIRKYIVSYYYFQINIVNYFVSISVFIKLFLQDESPNVNFADCP